MVQRRVFISSVIRDFGVERQAAEAAVTLLRHQPLMAEDFVAKPQSPQSACLDGVATSDIYIGVYGTRYGYVAPRSGLSATEEEFQEARKRGLPILCFVSRENKDDDQSQFLARVMGYEDGYTIARYESPSDLKDQIVKALNDYFGDTSVNLLDRGAAASHLVKHRWGAVSPPQHDVSLGLVVFPARMGEEYFTLRDLACKDMQDAFLKDAIFSSPALLPREQGVQTEDGRDFVEFSQTGNGFDERQRRLSVHSDGTITFGCILGTEPRSGLYNIVRASIIDQEEVHRCIEMFLRYAAGVYSHTDRSELISRLYFGGSLSGIRDKGFGIIPNPAPNGLGMPSHNLDDPLHIPEQALAIARASLMNAAKVAGDVVEQVRRTFKSVRAEYNSQAY